MADPGMDIFLAAPAPSESPLFSVVPILLMFLIFYFVLFMPMRTKQKKLEALVKSLKAGDKVIINPGIFGTIVGVDEDAFQVRIDDKTRIKILKSAVSGLQGSASDSQKAEKTEK